MNKNTQASQITFKKTKSPFESHGVNGKFDFRMKIYDAFTHCHEPSPNPKWRQQFPKIAKMRYPSVHPPSYPNRIVHFGQNSLKSVKIEWLRYSVLNSIMLLFVWLINVH